MTTMSAKLTGLKRDEITKKLIATYEVSYSDQKVTLTLDTKVAIDEQTGGAIASIAVDVPEQASVVEALQVLGHWLVRCGTALKEANNTQENLPFTMVARP